MYEILTLNERDEWQRVLDLFQITDVYYSSYYFTSAMKLDPGESLMFYYTDEEGTIVYPFIKRKLEGNEDGYFDITTPFGYGGPVAIVKKNVAVLIANFINAFSDYCREANIVAEFIRFHPLRENALLFASHYNLLPLYKTYTIQLNPLHKRHILMEENGHDESEESGIVIKKLGTVRHMFEFLVLYYSEVRRREETDSYYFFANDYFETLISSLGPNLHLFGAYDKNTLVSACYVLTAGDTIYHHIEGSLEEVDSTDAFKNILQKIAEWGEDNNFVFFHLGGDYKGDLSHDKKIKEELSNLENSMFFICENIHNPEIYKKFFADGETDIIKRYRNI